MSPGQLITLAALGAFHGLNPAMGWLFAVARGIQDSSRTRMLTALLPIAAGHLASVAIVAAVVSATASVVAANVIAIAGGVLLVTFGLWQLLSTRHFRWTGMRLSAGQLAGWSFLMSSAHGAGLMLLPVLLTVPMVTTGNHMSHTPDASPGGGALTGLLAAGVHTASMLAVMAACALTVHHFVGRPVATRPWFTIDRLWAAVLVTAGALTIAVAV
ncbi:hypothetical protein [Winogradskya humida]|uniref:Uncharacterized protein n=1 Tax=Winogradskya humida TaxID=113566 RepID=A0ABQ3ZPS1_9ACTN|nr:hypothetical protein [Actinoplanes humidus]GIE20548.1 hypothetical protein Ahu01nite_036500 [Actinoplanes humidus]